MDYGQSIADWNTWNEKNPGWVDVTNRQLLPPVGTILVHGCTAWGSTEYATVISHHDAKTCILRLQSQRPDNGKMNPPRDKILGAQYYRPLLDQSPEGVAKYMEYAVSLRRRENEPVWTPPVVTYEPADLSRWRALGLCPVFPGTDKTLVWKCVTLGTDGKYYGQSNASYEVGTSYDYPLSMATPGPVGAIKSYGKPGKYVLGIAAPRVLSLYEDGKPNGYDEGSGAYYAPHGTPVAAYRIDKIVVTRTIEAQDDYEFEATLVEGIDALALLD